MEVCVFVPCNLLHDYVVAVALRHARVGYGIHVIQHEK